jgi:HEAT repeat protein
MGLETTDRTGNAGFETGDPLPKTKGQEAENETDKKEELRSAKDLIQSLIKTTRTLKIYLHNNPIHQKFLKELKTKFDQHFMDYGHLQVFIQQHELLWDKEVLYQNTNRMESLAFRLYIDGIREITFHEGLEEGELVNFLEAVGRDSNQSRQDDDMATVFWEKGFSHITYQVAEDTAQGLIIEPSPPPTEKIKKAFQQETHTAEKPLSAVATGVQTAEHRIQDLVYQNVYALTEEEIAKVKHEMQTEEGQDLLSEMIQILTSILLVEDNLKDFDEVVKILQDMLDLMIGRGDFQHARRILEVFWELQAPEKGIPEQLREVVRMAIDWAGSGERIEKLKTVLNSETVRDLDHLHAYLVLHRKNAISPLVNLLGTLNKMKPRRILCEAMVELAREETDVLISRLTDRQWYTIRNIVYILGKIGNEKVVDALVPLIRHSETRVRKEVLRAYETLSGPKAKQYLMQFLKDDDSSIRILAAKTVAHSKIPGAVEHLLETISAVHFKDRDLYEKKEIFDALGRVGGNKILPAMQKILKQRAWFRIHKGRIEELQLCAIIALKRVKTPEAMKLLREGARLRNKNVREACTRVLNELEKDKG